MSYSSKYRKRRSRLNNKRPILNSAIKFCLFGCVQIDANEHLNYAMYQIVIFRRYVRKYIVTYPLIIDLKFFTTAVFMVVLRII